MLVSISSCREDVPLKNSSTLSTIPTNSDLVWIRSYLVDNSNQYLYVLFQEIITGNTAVRKINLADLSAEKEFVLSGMNPVGVDNMILTEDSKIMFSVVNGARISTIETFDTDLNHLNSDTIAVGNPYTRVLLNKSSKGGVDIVYNSFTDSGANYTEWLHTDNALNEQYKTADTSSEYNYIILGHSFINTEDGGSLYLARNYTPPAYNQDLMLEKRDKDFNFQWRSKFATPAEDGASSALLEHNGKYYMTSSRYDPENGFKNSISVVTFDLNGNLLENKPIASGGLDEGVGEPIVPTEDGGFLITGLTSLGTITTARTGILYQTDANFNVINTTAFGGNGAVPNSGLIKISNNRYLLMYPDNSFEASGSEYRLVLRYVDGNGKFIQ
jgi:hypothetical protein